MPPLRAKKPAATAGAKGPRPHATTTENQEEGAQVKRSSSPPHGAPKKRTAFIDITNAHKVQISFPGRRKKKEATKKPPARKASAPSSVATKNQANLKKCSSESSEDAPAERETPEEEEEEVEEEEEEEAAAAPVEELVVAAPPAGGEVPAHLQKQHVPAEFDIDSESSEDCYMCPEYAKDIFDYLKRREEKFVLCNSKSRQPSLNPGRRALLIAWRVEVQENSELYHETLYLAVKMTDHYLARTPVDRELLQLVGSTGMVVEALKQAGSEWTLCVLRVFFEVASLPLVSGDLLEEALSQ
uniref:G2/mitotic-specific cyclin-B3 n=1 Tax=Gasterosteus aculeatus aculeatus TaxID=481459 RepID=UPI001A99B57A|nr:G2/mitotic-specific cyclin-B3 [Gasterosteus aculeatus aculeatus]